MLDTTRPVEDLRDAIGVALAAGVSENEIVSMVATVAADAEQPELPGFEDEGLPIYTELPVGLTDLATAAKNHGCTVYRLRTWVHKGHLQVQGRLRGPAPGGGLLLVAEDQVRSRLANPPKNGRPRKSAITY